MTKFAFRFLYHVLQQTILYSLLKSGNISPPIAARPQDIVITLAETAFPIVTGRQPYRVANYHILKMAAPAALGPSNFGIVPKVSIKN